jgi:uncharacterized radical SAM superfamily Fe-S cluster-containing enzyme
MVVQISDTISNLTSQTNYFIKMTDYFEYVVTMYILCYILKLIDEETINLLQCIRL